MTIASLITSSPIEKGYPIPELRKENPNQEIAEFLKKLEVGDSFAVTLSDTRVLNSIAATCHGWAKKIGIKLATRTLKDERGRKVGMRVWRKS